MPNTVLIAGASGLVGTACAERYLADGWKIIGSHNYANFCFAYGATEPPPAFVSTIKIKQAGFTETSSVPWLKVLQECRPQPPAEKGAAK